MRVTIKGSATSEHFKQIVDSLNEEFSKYGNEVSRIITFRRSVTVPEEKKKTKKSKTKEVKEK